MLKKLRILTLFSIAALSCFGQEKSIKDLGFLIGEWEMEEIAYPTNSTNNPIVYKGKRKCGYYLGNSFIKCESEYMNMSDKKTRELVYLFNYDKKADCFWTTILASDFPWHDKQKWVLLADEKVVNMITPINMWPDRFFRGTISFEDENKLVWDHWKSIYHKDKEWFHAYRETMTRVE